MTHSFLKRFGIAVVAVALLSVPALSRADTSDLVLKSSLGAPARATRSLMSAPALGPEIGQMSWGLLAGLQIPPKGGDIGPRASVELMWGAFDLAPQLRLDLGARLAFSYHGAGAANVMLFDLVPDAKLRWAVADSFGIYGDVGVGPAYYTVSNNGPNGLAFTFQFGGGVAWAVTPNINLLGEIRLNVYTGDVDGLYVAIPQIGIEFH
jgi:hypothetical protein